MKVFERIIKAYFKSYNLDEISLIKDGDTYLIDTNPLFDIASWEPHQPKSVESTFEDVISFINHFPIELIVEITLDELDKHSSNASILVGHSEKMNNSRVAKKLRIYRATVAHHRSRDPIMGIVVLNGSVYIKQGKFNGKSNRYSER